MSGMQPGFRDARQDDWPFVERLYAEAVRSNYGYREEDAAAHVALRSQRWKLEGAYAIVAEEEGQSLGVVWVLPDAVAAGCDYVQLIAVDDPYRRRGIAEGLLRAAIERSRRRGRKTLRAGVDRRNRPSVDLFERLSFEAENPDAKLLMMNLSLETAAPLLFGA